MDESVFSLILQPILVCDRDGRIVSANDACELTFGLSERQLQRQIFPDFLNMKPAFPLRLEQILQPTLYREAAFDTGKRSGTVRYALQPFVGDRLVVCFHDSSLEVSLQTKYKTERENAKNLTKEVLGQRAELLLSQDLLERKVMQMSFLVNFYGQTRLVLEADLIAGEFLQMACETLSFQYGLYLSADPPGDDLRFGSLFCADEAFAGTLEKKLRTRVTGRKGSFAGDASEAVLRAYDEKSLQARTATDFYGHFGIQTPTNSAVLTIRDGERLAGQFHLVNFLHLPAIDKGTQELLTYMSDPLELTFRNAELYRASVTDELTQLNNVRFFRLKLESEIARSKKSEKPVSLIMIDLDHFKKVNDTYGHLVGDQVIRATAGALKASVRSTDTAARYGGEELAVILPNCDFNSALKVGEKIRRNLEALEIQTDKGPLKFTASLGVATFPQHSAQMDELIEKADQALYKAKHSGRNRVEGA